MGTAAAGGAEAAEGAPPSEATASALAAAAPPGLVARNITRGGREAWTAAGAEKVGEREGRGEAVTVVGSIGVRAVWAKRGWVHRQFLSRDSAQASFPVRPVNCHEQMHPYLLRAPQVPSVTPCTPPPPPPQLLVEGAYFSSLEGGHLPAALSPLLGASCLPGGSSGCRGGGSSRGSLPLALCALGGMALFLREGMLDRAVLPLARIELMPGTSSRVRGEGRGGGGEEKGAHTYLCVMEWKGGYGTEEGTLLVLIYPACCTRAGFCCGGRCCCCYWPGRCCRAPGLLPL